MLRRLRKAATLARVSAKRRDAPGCTSYGNFYRHFRNKEWRL
jgi:hypothetical protein